MSDTEAARQEARKDYQYSPHTENATEQSIQNAERRNEYNNELERQRQSR